MMIENLQHAKLKNFEDRTALDCTALNARSEASLGQTCHFKSSIPAGAFDRTLKRKSHSLYQPRIKSVNSDVSGKTMANPVFSNSAPSSPTNATQKIEDHKPGQRKSTSQSVHDTLSNTASAVKVDCTLNSSMSAEIRNKSNVRDVVDSVQKIEAEDDLDFLLSDQGAPQYPPSLLRISDDFAFDKSKAKMKRSMSLDEAKCGSSAFNFGNSEYFKIPNFDNDSSSRLMHFDAQRYSTYDMPHSNDYSHYSNIHGQFPPIRQGNAYNGFYNSVPTTPDPILTQFNGLEAMTMNCRDEVDEDNSARPKKRRSRVPSSIYRGVSRCGKDNKFQARIRVHGKVKYLGRFKSEIEAARCYDKHALEYLGVNAQTNFPPVKF